VRREAGAMGDFALGWLAAKQADVADGECVGSIRAFLKSRPYW